MSKQLTSSAVLGIQARPFLYSTRMFIAYIILPNFIAVRVKDLCLIEFRQLQMVVVGNLGDIFISENQNVIAALVREEENTAVSA